VKPRFLDVERRAHWEEEVQEGGVFRDQQGAEERGIQMKVKQVRVLCVTNVAKRPGSCEPHRQHDKLASGYLNTDDCLPAPLFVPVVSNFI
jgi:hypothetical protein